MLREGGDRLMAAATSGDGSGLQASIERSMSRMLVAEHASVVVACLQVITGILVLFVLVQLSGVLVPLTFAVFLAFLVEPVLSAIVWAPSRFCEAISNCCSVARRSRRDGQPRPMPPVAEFASVNLHLAAEGGGDDAADHEEAPAEPPCASNLERGIEVIAHSRPCELCGQRLSFVWDFASILLCVLALLGILTSMGLGFYASLNAMDWKTYTQSPKLKDVEELLKELGFNQTSWEGIAKHYQVELTSVATTMVGVFGDIVVTLLLFFFCLVALLPGIRERRPKSRIRRLMQRYLICKSISSLLIAGAVMLSLWALHVDLLIIFGIVTFLVNFIPNIGSFIAIVLPAPFVYLSPGRTIQDVILVVVIPFVIHNTFGCILEPQLMQAGLDLHPLTVVIALTFWGAVWGLTGMILSVPLTCAIRLLLQECSHPHAIILFDLLDSPLSSRKKTQQATLVPSETSSESTD